MNHHPPRRPIAATKPRPYRNERHRRGLGIAAAVIFAVLFETISTDAVEPERALVTLDYARPSERRDCPSASAVGRSIAVRLGYEPFAPAADRRLAIEIRANGASLEALIRFEQPDSPVVERSRVSSRGDCAELTEVASLTAATLIDPRAVFAGRRADVDASPPTVIVRDPGPDPSATLFDEPTEPRAVPSEPAPTWRVRVGARAGGCIGCAPRPNASFGLLVGVERQNWGVDFGGRWDLPTSSLWADGTGVAASLLVFEIFPHLTFGPLKLGPLGSLGSLSGKSIGVEGRDRDNSFWSSVGARAGIEVRFAGPFVAYAYVDGAYVLSRVRLVVRDVERWSSGPVASTASLGVLAAF